MKVGDRVRCTKGVGGAFAGEIYEITGFLANKWRLKTTDGRNFGALYPPECFEYSAAPPPEAIEQAIANLRRINGMVTR